MTPGDLVRALAKVPAKRLRVVELAWELADRNGHFDVQKAAARLDEVNDAAQEVKAYIIANRRVTERLSALVRW